MLSVIRTTSAVLVMLFCLCGCGSKNGGATQEVTDQEFALDRDASIRIADPRGSISIKGSDSDGLRLRTTKKSGGSEQLKNIGVTVSARHDDFAIKTTFVREKGKPYFGNGDSVDYTLTVPRGVKIQRLEVDNGDVLLEGLQDGEVRTNIVDGHLTVKNCYGDVHLEVENGALELAYERPEVPRSTVTARVLSGSARLTMNARAAFHVDAQAPGGTVTDNLGSMVQVNAGPLHKADFSLGKQPRSEIQLRVMAGNVSIVGAANVETAGGR